MRSSALFVPVFAVVALASATSCAAAPVAPSRAAATEAPIERPLGDVGSVMLRRLPAKPDAGGTDMLDYLVAEMAAQQGEHERAARAMLELAERAKDASVAKRAVEWALRARDRDLAINASLVWLRLDPESLAPHYVGELLAQRGNLEKAEAELTELLKASPAKTVMISNLYPMLARFGGKGDIRQTVERLTEPYVALPEAKYARGLAAFFANAHDDALKGADAVLAAQPTSERAALLKTLALKAKSPADSLKFAREFTSQNPGAAELRLQLARDLVSDKQLKEARSEFEAVFKLRPQDASIAFSLGLVEQQLQNYDAAERSFKQALALRYRDDDAVYMMLGELAETRKDNVSALQWFGRVDGDQQMVARRRMSLLIAKQDGAEAAIKFLGEMTPGTKQDRIGHWVTEAQILREAKRFQDAYAVLDGALKTLPNEPDLIYDRAMAAERIGKFDELERDLRQLIELKPDFAHAYNALGYTFADRNVRLAEAQTLIEKALSLQPDDPFILDSLGWVHFRLGNLEKAQTYLESAYKQRKDAEIAAHLIEVLIARGNRDGARRIYTEATKEHPNNEVLSAVGAKLKP